MGESIYSAICSGGGTFLKIILQRSSDRIKTSGAIMSHNLQMYTLSILVVSIHLWKLMHVNFHVV